MMRHLMLAMSLCTYPRSWAAEPSRSTTEPAPDVSPHAVVIIKAPTIIQRFRHPHAAAFRAEIPKDFVPSPTNAILDLRTPDYIVWRADGLFNHAGYREIRFFITHRGEERPAAWCSVCTEDNGTRALGISTNGTILVSYPKFKSRWRPLSPPNPPRYCIQPPSWFTTNATTKRTDTASTIFYGDSLDVPGVSVCFPTREDIVSQLTESNGTNSCRLAMKVTAEVDKQSRFAEWSIDVPTEEAKRIANGDIERAMTEMFPILDIKEDGVVFWNGNAWQSQNWAAHIPPRKPEPRDVEIRL